MTTADGHRDAPARPGPLELAGAVGVVTGAGSGIGRAIAHAMAGRGARVVVTDVDADRAADVAAQIVAAGGQAVGTRVDVTDLDALRAARDLAVDRYGQVDVVVNNVGVMAVGEPTDIPIAEWQRIIDVNLLGVVRSNDVFLPVLRERPGGHVLNTSSAAGLLGYAYDRMPYSVTKAAVIALSEALFLYLRPYGVGVSCLCPAGVVTNILEQMRFFGPPRPSGGPSAPEFPILEAETVGEIAVAGMIDRRFLILTDDGVAAALRRRAADPDAYLADRADRLDAR
jgi:NAD(P)-dependent dehydrogenase (short-subunit alcohol dehydrogenase family)